VLANDNEMVLLPINEPTFGTARKSQIQTYLEQVNTGPDTRYPISEILNPNPPEPEIP
jgi:4-hydroxyphenylpyruvate dioxygenase